MKQTLLKDFFENGLEKGFPMSGVDGYAGEQDGSTVLLLRLNFPTKKALGRMTIHSTSAIKVHWCHYTKKGGWTVVLGTWDNETYGKEELKAFRKIWLEKGWFTGEIN